MQLLLISNSTMPGEPFFTWPRAHAQAFLEGRQRIAFVPFAAVEAQYDAYADKVADAEGLLGITQANLGLAVIAAAAGSKGGTEAMERLAAAGRAIQRADAMTGQIDYDVLAQQASTHARFERACRQIAGYGVAADGSDACKLDHSAQVAQLTQRLRKLSPRVPITL